MLSHFLLQKAFTEHHFYISQGEIIEEYALKTIPQPIYFKSNKEKVCVFINEQTRKLNTSYYIGVDWLPKTETCIYVEPKLNKNSNQTNYLSMLFSALKHPEISTYTEELFDIKWEQPQIEIEQLQDHLTPLLVVQFLNITKKIVKKGLKKSYYKVENNLHCRVKGKILVSKTIKHNILKNKLLNTYCGYDEFGVDNLENRLLKKALLFVQRYMPTLKIPHSKEYIDKVFNYVMPAFDFVSEEVSLYEIKHGKFNPFYKEYSDGIRLARLILKRFGYNIANTEQKIVKTPPFWIDMSKLFELYVLGLLKDKFGCEVIYQFNGSYGNADYLLTKEQIVADAKYKQQYQSEKISFDEYLIKDIRQLAGYARDKDVISKLGINNNTVAECLIIYPMPLLQTDNDFTQIVDLNNKQEVNGFEKFFKIGVKLPVFK
jgi:5-methylcytosine-specific restriction enzyme subunit McrC